MTTKNTNVLKLYRKMLYSMMYVFKGDYETFHMMRINIRNEIHKSREITDAKQIRERMVDMEEMRNLLLTQVMQGKLQDGGFYRFTARPENVVGADVKPINKKI